MIDRSNTLCTLPWMHLHSWPDGKAMLCCVAHGGENGGQVGDFSKNTFQEIMNSEKMKQVRLDLMNGVKIPECSACWKDEKLGKHSFRLSTDNYANMQELLDKTDGDGTIKDPKMLYMDFRFSNLCNLGCQTCGSPLSSTIANNRTDNQHEEEILRKRGVLSDRGTITSFVYARPDFMDVDVYPYLEECKGFYFAGGEPLMHQEHLDILNYLCEHQLCDKKMITYSTNLTLLKWKSNDFLDIWKNFNNLFFYCSIDGQGDLLEYVREFSKHKTVFKNLERLLDFKKENPDKNISINICYTHSLYNAYYTKEFFQYLFDSGLLDRLNYIELNFAYSDNNSPGCLPEFAKKELKLKRAEDRESDVMQYAFSKIHNLRHYFDAIDSVIDEDISPDVFDKLIRYKLQEDLPKIKKAVPWLASVIERRSIK